MIPRSARNLLKKLKQKFRKTKETTKKATPPAAPSTPYVIPKPPLPGPRELIEVRVGKRPPVIAYPSAPGAPVYHGDPRAKFYSRTFYVIHHDLVRFGTFLSDPRKYRPYSQFDRRNQANVTWYMNLPNVDPEAFAAWLFYVENKRIEPLPQVRRTTLLPPESPVPQCLRLYCFADQLCKGDKRCENARVLRQMALTEIHSFYVSTRSRNWPLDTLRPNHVRYVLRRQQERTQLWSLIAVLSIQPTYLEHYMLMPEWYAQWDVILDDHPAFKMFRLRFMARCSMNDRWCLIDLCMSREGPRVFKAVFDGSSLVIRGGAVQVLQ